MGPDRAVVPGKAACGQAQEKGTQLPALGLASPETLPSMETRARQGPSSPLGSTLSPWGASYCRPCPSLGQAKGGSQITLAQGALGPRVWGGVSPPELPFLVLRSSPANLGEGAGAGGDSRHGPFSRGLPCDTPCAVPALAPAVAEL